MPEQAEHESTQVPQRRYLWPWFVLGGVVLGIVLAVLWLSHEVERTRRIRDLNTPPPQAGTNAHP
jgi:hypothetical protein